MGNARIDRRKFVIGGLIALGSLGGCNSNGHNGKTPTSGHRCTTPTSGQVAPKNEFQRRYQAALERPFDSTVLNSYLEMLPRADEGYVVDGDMVLTWREVQQHLSAVSAELQNRESFTLEGSELIVNLDAGQRDYWRDRSTRTLAYAVDRGSFPSATHYETALEIMRQAERREPAEQTVGWFRGLWARLRALLP